MNSCDIFFKWTKTTQVGGRRGREDGGVGWKDMERKEGARRGLEGGKEEKGGGQEVGKGYVSGKGSVKGPVLMAQGPRKLKQGGAWWRGRRCWK